MPLKSILFIGNSFTAANGGLGLLLEELARSFDSASKLATSAITMDGAILKRLWEDSDARSEIRGGAYEFVVVQGDIAEGDLQTFDTYARKFVAEAQRAGARTVLFMGWAYERLGWINQGEIARAHNLVALESGSDVAPVGLAWSRVMKERPALNLFSADREHPNKSGSYLAACVVYATVMNRSPERADPQSSTEGIAAEQARYLECVAWETVQANRL